MWKSVLGIATTLSLPALLYVTRKYSYGELKASKVLEGREKVKMDVRRLALRGWMKNSGDDNWSLDEDEKAEVDTTAFAGRES